eukprot:6191014-Pleurochrysis_carterae.AAC.1
MASNEYACMLVAGQPDPAGMDLSAIEGRAYSLEARGCEWCKLRYEQDGCPFRCHSTGGGARAWDALRSCSDVQCGLACLHGAHNKLADVLCNLAWRQSFLVAARTHARTATADPRLGRAKACTPHRPR